MKVTIHFTDTGSLFVSSATITHLQGQLFCVEADEGTYKFPLSRIAHVLEEGDDQTDESKNSYIGFSPDP